MIQLPFHLPQDMQAKCSCAAQLLGFVILKEIPTVQLLGAGVDSVGFYCDFSFPQSVPQSLIDFFEVKLRTLIKEDQPIRSISMMRENAQSLFDHMGQPQLAIELQECPDNIVTLISIDDYYGLCLPFDFDTTLSIGVVKLIGQEPLIAKEFKSKAQSIRIRGVLRQNPQELKRFLKDYDLMTRKKDSWHLAEKLRLFSHSQIVGAMGMTWLAKGIRLKKILEEWVLVESGQREEEVMTSSVLLHPRELPKNSRTEAIFSAAAQTGLDNYSHEQPIGSFDFEDANYFLRETLNRQHVDFLARRPFDSNKIDRLVESAQVYRSYPETSRLELFCSVVSSIRQTTVRCLPTQVLSELISSLHFIEQIITMLGFKGHWVLVVPRLEPKQKNIKPHLGTQPHARQRQYESWYREALTAVSGGFPVSEETAQTEGNGAFLQLRVLDAIGREWTLSTVTILGAFLNFQEQTPAEDGRLENVKSHRDKRHLEFDQKSSHPEEKSLIVFSYCLWDSLDRLIGLLIERNEGKLPFWLVPEQVRLLVIGAANQAYAQSVAHRMRERKIRVTLDSRSDALNQRVREAEEEKIPYLVLIGEKERDKNQLSLRSSQQSGQSQLVDCELFIERLYQESLCPSNT